MFQFFSYLLVSNESLGLLHWEPGDIIFINQVKDVRFGTVKLVCVNGFQVNHEMKILPDRVVMILMMLEAFICVSVEPLSINLADKADIFGVFVSRLFGISQLSKSINDDTENNVE
jgi:hypothetical protein